MGAELSIRLDSKGPIRVRRDDLPSGRANSIEVGRDRHGVPLHAYTNADGGILLHNPAPTIWESGYLAFELLSIEGEGVEPWAFASRRSDGSWMLNGEHLERDMWRAVIMGGEVWPFLPNSALDVPRANLESVVAMAATRMNGDLLDAPRIRHLMNLYRDSGAPKGALGSRRDRGWLQRHWNYRFGSVPTNSTFDAMALRGTDGFSAWHYDDTLWMAFAQQGRQGAVETFPIIHAYLEATWGFVHSGRYAGMRHYEKGHHRIGAQQNPTWGKQFVHGLAAWAAITGSETIFETLNALFAQALARPANAWGGDWGAREASNWLAVLECAYGITGDERYRDHALAAIRHIMALRDPIVGIWLNRGNNGAAPTSPWMQAQLAEVIMRWIYFHNVGWEFVGELIATMRAIVATGMDTFHGKPRTFYRSHPMPDRSGHPLTHNADMARMVLCLAVAQPALYRGLYDDLVGFISEWAGSSWPDVVAGVPDPIDAIGAEYHEQGAGWLKSTAITLRSLIL